MELYFPFIYEKEEKPQVNQLYIEIDYDYTIETATEVEQESLIIMDIL